MGFRVSELFFRKSEGMSEAETSACAETPEIEEEHDRILNVGFSARSPSNNLIVS